MQSDWSSMKCSPGGHWVLIISYIIGALRRNNPNIWENTLKSLLQNSCKGEKGVIMKIEVLKITVISSKYCFFFTWTHLDKVRTINHSFIWALFHTIWTLKWLELGLVINHRSVLSPCEHCGPAGVLLLIQWNILIFFFSVTVKVDAPN